MSLLEPFAAAGLVAALLYVGDRGIAFHVCLYAAIASGRRFRSEQAYKVMDNPFSRAPRLLLAAMITVAVFVFTWRGGIGAGWPAVVAISAVALAYIAVSTAYAFKAFRRTQYGMGFAEAVQEGRWRDR